MMMGVGIVTFVLALIPILGQLANFAINLFITPFTIAMIFSIFAGLKDPKSN